MSETASRHTECKGLLQDIQNVKDCFKTYKMSRTASRHIKCQGLLQDIQYVSDCFKKYNLFSLKGGAKQTVSFRTSRMYRYLLYDQVWKVNWSSSVLGFLIEELWCAEKVLHISVQACTMLVLQVSVQWEVAMHCYHINWSWLTSTMSHTLHHEMDIATLEAVLMVTSWLILSSHAIMSYKKSYIKIWYLYLWK